MADMQNTVNAFIERLAAKRTKATVEAYERDLRHFVEFLTERGLAADFSGVTPTAVLGFIAHIGETGAQSSAARALSALKTFFDDLIRRGGVSFDPTENVAPPALGRQEKRLTPEDFSWAIEGTRPSDLRDRAILDLLSEGVKPGAIITMSTADVLEDGEALRIGSGRRVSLLRLKKPAALQEYLKLGRADLLKEENENETALFLNRSGTAMTRQSVWKLLDRYRELTQK